MNALKVSLMIEIYPARNIHIESWIDSYIIEVHGTIYIRKYLDL